FAAWVFSIVASKGLRRALALTSNISRLLGAFLEGTVRWIIITIGIIMALAAMEVSIAPLLALLGAAGFIIALALQDSLSNFASGIMILFFRPFDVDDVVDAGGVSGKVTTVSLVSTTIMTFDNKKMLVPNNKIWRDVITNATDVKTRRVDLEFSVHYDSDILLVQGILEDIVAEHPKVLENPVPAIHLHIIANDSIKFVCRPWIKSVEYWSVYWDLVKEAKMRFDAAGVKVPHPPQDVHLFVEKQSAENVASPVQEIEGR
ncbi:MAG: mechanosensitive ion channel protein MscS, partial [Desulfocapsa sp.]